MTLVETIKKDLKAKLSAHRYAHIESVVETALGFLDASSRQLKQESNVDAALRARIELAAWLHDVAKELKNEEQLSLAEYYGVEIYPEDRLAPNLLHARNGAAIAEERYEISDPRVLNAIREHTFGGLDMCLESKIVYLADALEPGRDADIKKGAEPNNKELKYSKSLDQMRNLVAAGDIDAALLMAMDAKLKYVLKKRQPLHPLGMAARNFLLAHCR